MPHPQLYDIGPIRNANVSSADHRQKDFNMASRRFIAEVKKFKGAEAASRIIESFSDALGKEWSTQLIYDMVVGDPIAPDDTKIMVTATDFTAFIPMIKAIRGATGTGLKEAKDAMEELRDAVAQYNRDNSWVDPETIPYLKLKLTTSTFYGSHDGIMYELRDAGFTVREAV